MRASMFSILFAFALTPAAHASAQPPTSLVHEPGSVLVEGPRILLRDVSSMMPDALGSVDIGPSPGPGKSTTVSRSGIKSALSRAGADPSLADALPAYLRVTRAAKILDVETLESQIKEALADQIPEGVEISAIHNSQAQQLPVGPHHVEARLGPLRGSTVATIRILSNGRAFRSFPVQVLLKGEPRAPVLTQKIERNAVVSADQVQMQPTSWGNLQTRSALRAEDLVGRRAIHDLAANAPIPQSAVREPPVIARGAEITLLAVGRGLRIVQPAMAQEDGLAGQYIRVRPTSGTRTLRAKVISANEARIDLEASP